MDREDMFWQVYLNLEDEVINLSKYISITDNITKINSKTNQIQVIEKNNQLEVYSPHIADLLVRCCVEIEAISKELYFDNGGQKIRGSNDIYFDTDCIALLNQKWNLNDKQVLVSSINFNFINDNNKILTPLKKADKRSGTYWAKCYQAVKHDRYNCLYMGNIKALLNALAALYLLNIYNKNVKLTIKYTEIHNLNMSFGSKLFSLTKPDQKYLIDVINGKEISEILHSTSCPYILKYTNQSYKQIIKACHESSENMQKYLSIQPELKESGFINLLRTTHNKEPIFWLLGKYRLNKKIPSTLSYEDRKRLFINSYEWKGRIRQLNNPKTENEITEENIQAEIDHAGIQAGIELQQCFENIRIIKGINEGVCELILDKNDTKYSL